MVRTFLSSAGINDKELPMGKKRNLAVVGGKGRRIRRYWRVGSNTGQRHSPLATVVSMQVLAGHLANLSLTMPQDVASIFR